MKSTCDTFTHNIKTLDKVIEFKRINYPVFPLKSYTRFVIIPEGIEIN